MYIFYIKHLFNNILHICILYCSIIVIFVNIIYSIFIIDQKYQVSYFYIEKKKKQSKEFGPAP